MPDSAPAAVDTGGPLERLPNWKIAVAALYALRGATARRGTGDIALRCFEMAPRRFGWRGHPQLEPARAALRAAKKPASGAFVTGTDAAGWLLTEAGRAWCDARLDSSPEGLRARGWSALTVSEARTLRRFARQPLFSRWQGGERDFATYEIADSLGFPADAPVPAVRHRLEELLAAARTAEASELADCLGSFRNSVS